MDDRKKKNEEAEERSFHLVKSAFSQYAPHAAAVFDRAQPRYDGLPEKFRALLPDLDDHFLSLHGCAAANGEFFLTLSEAAPHDIFLNQEVVAGTAEKTNPTESDIRSVLRHLVRDWSAEGAS
ncbi:Carnosine N-methyltransferase [Diplonema papillatum]|nr:Carnosine N-methyltransferase [Diplonema papillatum]